MTNKQKTRELLRSCFKVVAYGDKFRLERCLGVQYEEIGVYDTWSQAEDAVEPEVEKMMRVIR